MEIQLLKHLFSVLIKFENSIEVRRRQLNSLIEFNPIFAFNYLKKFNNNDSNDLVDNVNPNIVSFNSLNQFIVYNLQKKFSEEFWQRFLIMNFNQTAFGLDCFKKVFCPQFIQYFDDKLSAVFKMTPQIITLMADIMNLEFSLFIQADELKSQISVISHDKILYYFNQIDMLKIQKLTYANLELFNLQYFKSKEITLADFNSLKRRIKKFENLSQDYINYTDFQGIFKDSIQLSPIINFKDLITTEYYAFMIIIINHEYEVKEYLENLIQASRITLLSLNLIFKFQAFNPNNVFFQKNISQFGKIDLIKISRNYLLNLIIYKKIFLNQYDDSSPKNQLTSSSYIENSPQVQIQTVKYNEINSKNENDSQLPMKQAINRKSIFGPKKSDISQKQIQISTTPQTRKSKIFQQLVVASQEKFQKNTRLSKNLIFDNDKINQSIEIESEYQDYDKKFIMNPSLIQGPSSKQAKSVRNVQNLFQHLLRNKVTLQK